MKLRCPACAAEVPATQINVATDLAVCAHCHETFSLSQAVAGGAGRDDVDLAAPPPGAWFEDLGSSWRVGATTRSPMAFFLVPFICVWSGGSLGGLYGSQIIEGKFNLLLSLFGIPFLLGTLFFGSLALMTVAGRVVVSCDRDEGRIFTGVGPFGWTRRFDWNDIDRVEECLIPARRSTYYLLALVGRTRLRFGALVSDARRHFLANALRMKLAERQSA